MTKCVRCLVDGNGHHTVLVKHGELRCMEVKACDARVLSMACVRPVDVLAAKLRAAGVAVNDGRLMNDRRYYESMQDRLRPPRKTVEVPIELMARVKEALLDAAAWAPSICRPVLAELEKIR